MSVLLGILAAIAWGFHDLCVRYVSRETGIFASIVAVLTFGFLLVLPVSLYAQADMPEGNTLSLGLLSGVLFGFAMIAHYKAFSIGPVRLVAPIIGAYPALSVGWAVWSGTPVTALQWLAVAAIIAGVGYVAGSSDDAEEGGSTVSAILWSVLAGVFFAVTFAVGQAASASGGELALLAPTRLAALVTVLAIALVGRIACFAKPAQLKVLALMGALDGAALGAVLSSGGFDNPELASVIAATFGLITVVLASIFLKERLKSAQWGAVALVFAAIAYLAA